MNSETLLDKLQLRVNICVFTRQQHTPQTNKTTHPHEQTSTHALHPDGRAASFVNTAAAGAIPHARNAFGRWR